MSTRGDVSATFDPAADVAAEGENQWLDRASSAVEVRLGDLGTDYLAILIERLRGPLGQAHERCGRGRRQQGGEAAAGPNRHDPRHDGGGRTN